MQSPPTPVENIFKWHIWARRHAILSASTSALACIVALVVVKQLIVHTVMALLVNIFYGVVEISTDNGESIDTITGIDYNNMHCEAEEVEKLAKEKQNILSLKIHISDFIHSFLYRPCTQISCVQRSILCSVCAIYMFSSPILYLMAPNWSIATLLYLMAHYHGLKHVPKRLSKQIGEDLAELMEPPERPPPRIMEVIDRENLLEQKPKRRRIAVSNTMEGNKANFSSKLTANDVSTSSKQ